MPRHFDTPQKSKILGAKAFIEYLKENEADKDGNVNLCRLRGGGKAIAECFGTSSKEVSTIVSAGRERRHFKKEIEKRGGFRGDEILQLGKEQLDKCEEIIEENGYDGHDISENTLRYEAQLPRVSSRTIRRGLRSRDIGRYIAETVEGISEADAYMRLESAKDLLSRFPTKYEWRKVRFSDELHFGYGQEENKHYIYRRKGTRYNPDCIRRIEPPLKKRKKAPKRDNIRKDEETKEVHFFAIVGYEFKPDLYEYTVPTNNTGKMSGEIYIKILRAVIEPLLKRGDNFILEEDRDGAHCSKEVLVYKKKIGLKSYLNTPRSPDLSVLENPCASMYKNEFRKGPRLTLDDIRKEAKRSWDLIDQGAINRAIDSMPERLQCVIDSNGQKTHF